MTSQQIAVLTGKSQRAVQLWIKGISEKTSLMPVESDVVEKYSNSSPKKPADYSLDEVLVILKAGGMSDVVARVLEMNARSSTKHVLVKTDNELRMFSKYVQKAVTGIVSVLTRNSSEPDKKQLFKTTLMHVNDNVYWAVFGRTSSEMHDIVGADVRSSLGIEDLARTVFAVTAAIHQLTTILSRGTDVKDVDWCSLRHSLKKRVLVFEANACAVDLKKTKRIS